MVVSKTNKEFRGKSLRSFWARSDHFGEDAAEQRCKGAAIFETHTSQVVEIRQGRLDLQQGILNVMKTGLKLRLEFVYLTFLSPHLFMK